MATRPITSMRSPSLAEASAPNRSFTTRECGRAGAVALCEASVGRNLRRHGNQGGAVRVGWRGRDGAGGLQQRWRFEQLEHDGEQQRQQVLGGDQLELCKLRFQRLWERERVVQCAGVHGAFGRCHRQRARSDHHEVDSDCGQWVLVGGGRRCALSAGVVSPVV